MEFGQESPITLNASFRLDGGLATPQAQQKLIAVLEGLASFACTDVTIQYGIAGAAGASEVSDQALAPTTATVAEAGKPAELSEEEQRERYLGMSLSEVLDGFPEIDEKHRRMAGRRLARRDVANVRDLIMMGRQIARPDQYIRVAVRDALYEFVAERLPGITWQEESSAEDIAVVCTDLRDVPAAAFSYFFRGKRTMAGERYSMHDILSMSVDDLMAFYSGGALLNAEGEITTDECEIADFEEASAVGLRVDIQTFAVDFLHARQAIDESRSGRSDPFRDAAERS